MLVDADSVLLSSLRPEQKNRVHNNGSGFAFY
jgi:hypothetical protein